MHAQHLHYYNPTMAPTLTTSKSLNHNQNILVMLDGQIKGISKIQTPPISKPPDGKWL